MAKDEDKPNYLAEYWKDVRAGRSEPSPRTQKRGRENLLTRRLKNLPLTDDPILKFIRTNFETMGMGYIPEDLGGKSLEQITEEIRERTVNTLENLYGREWRKLVKSAGMSPTTWGYIAKPKTKRYASKTVANKNTHLRLAHLVMLTHIASIRETLRDFEREIWILMQLAHDPRLGPEFETRRKSEARKRIKQNLGKVRTEYTGTYGFNMLPLRVRANLIHPDVDEHIGIKRERERLRKEREQERNEKIAKKIARRDQINALAKARKTVE